MMKTPVVMTQTQTPMRTLLKNKNLKLKRVKIALEIVVKLKAHFYQRRSQADSRAIHSTQVLTNPKLKFRLKKISYQLLSVKLEYSASIN